MVANSSSELSGKGRIISSIIIIMYYLSSARSTTCIQNSQDQILLTREMVSSKIITITNDDAVFGYITSPGYPEPFPINSSSVVALIGKSNGSFEFDTIRLTFIDLQLELTNFCDNEVLEILLIDGQDYENPLEMIQSTNKPIYKICGSNIPKPVIINRASILLHLFSDAFNPGTSKGFALRFEFMNSQTQLNGNNCELKNYFRCRNRNCIPEELKCNRVDDCGDASDEDMFTPCDLLPTIPYKINYLCGQVSLDGIGGRYNHNHNYNYNYNYNYKPPRKQLASLVNNRILGGNPVEKSLGWPFAVSIQLWRIESISHICGGTLIHPMFVISAAHCFKGFLPASDYRLIFGATDLKNMTNVQYRYANFITLFPGSSTLLDLNNVVYRQADLTQDLALIELNAPVKLNAQVWPACLPHLNEPIQAGRGCLNTGFGDTRGTNGAFLLKQVSQQIQVNSACCSKLNEYEIDDFSMICVKSKLGEGPCNGDSGGPLFCADNLENKPTNPEREEYKKQPVNNLYNHLKAGQLIKYLPIRLSKENSSRKANTSLTNMITWTKRYTVHGITSFTTAGNLGGGFCGLQNVSTIYTRVSTKVDWILSQMKLALYRLNKADCLQDPHNSTAFFGYMFRTGVSRHVNFTAPMTVYSND